MSLYEALDRFVGTGVLACAGLVEAAWDPGLPYDGAAFSRYLREHNLGEEFGNILDALAREIWLAQEQRGFPQALCETHIAALSPLLSEVRFTPEDFAQTLKALQQQQWLGPTARPGEFMGSAREQIALAWVKRAKAGGYLHSAKLIEEVTRFLLEHLFWRVIEQPGLLVPLKAALIAFREQQRTQAKATTMGERAPPLPTAEPPGHAPTHQLAQEPAHQPAPKPTETSLARPPAQSLSAAVRQIQAHHGLGDGALRRLQASLVSQRLSQEQRLARLDELAGWLVATIAQLRRPSNDAAELNALKLQAADALELGELERAMERLGELRARLRDCRRQTEARLAEEIGTLRAQMQAEAEAVARMGELALARFDFGAAATLFEEAAGNLPLGETELEFDYRQRQAEALANKAEMAGDANALRDAAEAFRNAMQLLPANAEPAIRARVSVGLGDMLMAIGCQSQVETGPLEKAVAAYADAVGVIDRDCFPMRWALIQLSHAAALIELGNRSDQERNWKEAAAALLPALEIFELRGATDLAASARHKLKTMIDGLEHQKPMLSNPVRSA